MKKRAETAGRGVRVVKPQHQTWKLEIEYDGTRYSGWQIQANARTVQGELFKAAGDLFQSEIELGGAGRTDAGVHALQQVAHLRAGIGAQSPSNRDLQFELNKALPHDINVLSVQSVHPRFHARHDALSRYYLYQISTRRRAFGKNHVWWVRDRLDSVAMTRACDALTGRHDFRSFTESPETQSSTVVEIHEAQIVEVNELLLFRIGADHFLWKMVRRIVGALVEVGRGTLDVSQFEQLLETESRDPAPWTAPPSGLFLERVLYAGDQPPGEIKPAFYRM